MMLLPAYSLRRLLLLVTLCGFLFLVPAMATRGYLWAIAVAAALASACVLLLIQGLLYLAARGVGAAFSRRAAAGAGDR